MAEEKDYSEENKRRMLIALAILLGADLENNLVAYKDIPKDIKSKALKLYKDNNMQLQVEQPARIPEQQVQI